MSTSPTRRKKRADATPRSFDVVERAVVELRREMRTPARRETNRHHVTAGCKHGRWVSAAMIVAGLLGNLKVFGQFIDRGAVDMSCDEECYCEGDSDDGTITVFDIPSSGQRVAAVDGQYLGVLETSCDTLVISVGENLYDLSGVDLVTRNMEAVETSSINCADANFADASSDAECFSGTSETFEGDDFEMTITFYVDRTSEVSSVTFRSKVNLVVMGTGDFDPDVGEIKLCVGQGFVSQLFTSTVQGNEYMFNYELVIPGEDTSSDLSVTSTPSSAGDFACGTETEPTPSSMEPPTSAPLRLTPAEPKPTVEPTPEPTSYPTPGYGASSPEAEPMPTPEATPDVAIETSNPSPRELFPTPPSITTSVGEEWTLAPTNGPTSDPTSGPTTEATPTPTPEVKRQLRDRPGNRPLKPSLLSRISSLSHRLVRMGL
ncbi:unnamed protein product [Ascophyllum nodosum]